MVDAAPLLFSFTVHCLDGRGKKERKKEKNESRQKQFIFIYLFPYANNNRKDAYCGSLLKMLQQKQKKQNKKETGNENLNIFDFAQKKSNEATSIETQKKLKSNKGYQKK
eukprot:TRINITY_DN6622_c1_g1_i1.p1 TRINITY_DN6622_c1_g1~~TRINITY_DN6622_c1_g1_i1.p1  ORF type:complete len:110 (-),score=15.58 TRINITY_DN6622_c1_g1_i1:367-696(-)